MPFDSEIYSRSAPTADIQVASMIEAAVELCPLWTALNPDRAMALLFVAPHDCAAVDVLLSL